MGDLPKAFRASSGPVAVLVDGWVNRPGGARRNVFKNISDHCLLLAEIP